MMCADGCEISPTGQVHQSLGVRGFYWRFILWAWPTSVLPGPSGVRLIPCGPSPHHRSHRECELSDTAQRFTKMKIFFTGRILKFQWLFSRSLAQDVSFFGMYRVWTTQACRVNPLEHTIRASVFTSQCLCRLLLNITSTGLAHRESWNLSWL